MIVCLLSSWGSSYLWNFKSRWVTERFSKVLKHFNFSRFFFSLLKIPLFCFSCLSYKSMQHSLCYAVNSSEYCNKLYDFHSNLRALSSLTVCLSLLYPSCLSDMGRIFFCGHFFSSNKYFAVFFFPASFLISFKMYYFPTWLCPIRIRFFYFHFFSIFFLLNSFMIPVFWVRRLFWLVKSVIELLKFSIQVLFCFVFP